MMFAIYKDGLSSLFTRLQQVTRLTAGVVAAGALTGLSVPTPASAQTPVLVDLSINKTGQITAWDTANHVYDAEYTLTVFNNGPSPSSGSIVTDILPEAFSIDQEDLPGEYPCTVYTDDAPDGPAYYDDGTIARQLICTIGPLPEYQEAVFSITGTVPDDADLNTVENVASVMGNEHDPNPDNDMGWAGLVDPLPPPPPPLPPPPASGAIGAVTPVPALDVRALALLAVLMGGLAWFIRRKIER
jgi:hypothetical protein